MGNRPIFNPLLGFGGYGKARQLSTLPVIWQNSGKSG
jgi:hypothetical protein